MEKSIPKTKKKQQHAKKLFLSVHGKYTLTASLLLVEWVYIMRAQPCQDHPHLPMNTEGFKELPPEEGIDLKGRV